MKNIESKIYYSLKHKLQRRNLALIFRGILFFSFCTIGFSCKKMIAIDSPTSSITTQAVFHDSTDANVAIMGIYSSMINTSNPLFTSGAITIYGGMSADELIKFQNSIDDNQVYLNALTSSNGNTYNNLWKKSYPIIYQANACIEGLSSSELSSSVKNQFIGEAKFIRAFCYFYLVNLFGDVPYITSTNYSETSLAERSSISQVYGNITSDLKDAESLLKADYSISGGERIRANKWAIKALLAKVYLYNKKWDSAAQESSDIIGNVSMFSLDSLNGTFLKNSKESILQWGLNPPTSSRGNETPEGYTIIPPNRTSNPFYFLNTNLLTSFEPNDQRRVKWVDSTKRSGITYYYPYKYKIGRSQYSNTVATEYYMVLRLAEQYLIRAEAEANSGPQQNLSQAIADLNIIRNRAGLPNYSGATDQTSILNAIMHERQIELFCEWGNRWLDLKRTGKVDAVMSVATPQKNGGGTWKSYQQLYPIPFSEIQLDPNLTQNPGY